MIYAEWIRFILNNNFQTGGVGIKQMYESIVKCILHNYELIKSQIRRW